MERLAENLDFERARKRIREILKNRVLRYFGNYSNRDLIRTYAQLSRAQGIGQLVLVLSFDCDTPEDALAAERLHPVLERKGIRATYAVPGEQLRAGHTIYHRLAEAGAPFINHGALPHAEWRNDRYHSITFYNELSTEEVIADIRRGHEIVLDVTGRPPDGFRAPHFGYYQQPQQLQVVHDTARELGYRFCTTTLPSLALAQGPAIDMGGLYEFPLSGSLRAPTTILDSWNYLSDRRDYALKKDYFRDFRETVDFFLKRGLPGVLNYYVDPAHVVDAEPFHRALDYAVARNLPTLHYTDLAALMERARSVSQP